MIVTDLSNSFNPVPKKKTEKKKEVTTIKKKSKKLVKLERQRDKNLVKEGICEFCGNYSRHLDPHEVYGGTYSRENKWLPDVDGSYGSNDNGIFFFTPDGKYVEWSGTYLYSDIPFEVKDAVVTYKEAQ